MTTLEPDQEPTGHTFPETLTGDGELPRQPEPCGYTDGRRYVQSEGGWETLGDRHDGEVSRLLHFLRVGRDSTCGNPYHVRRAGFRFNLTQLDTLVQKQEVVFSLYRVVNLQANSLGATGPGVHTGVGTLRLERVGGTQLDQTTFAAPALRNLGPMVTPGTPQGRVRIVVTAAVQDALADGLGFILRLRLEDESDQDALGGLAWYPIGSAESSQTLRPQLEIVTVIPMVEIVDPITARATLLTPLERSLTPTLLPVDPTDFEAVALTTVKRGNPVTLHVGVRDRLEFPGAVEEQGPVVMTLRAMATGDDVTTITMGRISSGRFRATYLTQGTDPLGLYRVTLTVAGHRAFTGMAFTLIA